MIWGINIKKYLAGGNRCKFYGDKSCPCMTNKEIRKQYDKKNGYWATGSVLPECDKCDRYQKRPQVCINTAKYCHNTEM